MTQEQLAQILASPEFNILIQVAPMVGSRIYFHVNDLHIELKTTELNEGIIAAKFFTEHGEKAEAIDPVKAKIIISNLRCVHEGDCPKNCKNRRT